MHLRDCSYTQPPQPKRKRLSDQEALPVSSPRPAKRRKQNGASHSVLSNSFWDNLSRHWLTRRTLREFDRRTSSLPLTSSVPRDRSLTTQLKRFARHGGPSLEDLRSYPKPTAMSSSRSRSRKTSSHKVDQSSSSSLSKSTRKTSAYDPAFEQHLLDNGVSMSHDGEVPNNMDEILHRLRVPRSSLSPSNFTAAEFHEFQRQNEAAKNESGVMTNVFPLITGKQDISSQQNIEFTNLSPLTDGSLANAKPDLYDGARPGNSNRQLRTELGPFIVPSNNTSGPCLPNFFVEGKGPGGSGTIAKRQACYSGVLGARGMHEVRCYQNTRSALDGNAYTIASTYVGGDGSGSLTLYAIHPTASGEPNHLVYYRMTQLDAWHMNNKVEEFRKGATALRNAREWSNEKRDEVIAAANKRLDLQATANSARHKSKSLTRSKDDSDTSTDELSRDDHVLTSFTSTPSFDPPSSQSSQSSSKQHRPSGRPERTKKRARKRLAS